MKLCGHDLETVINHTVDFTLIVKFGVSNLISKTFTVRKISSQVGVERTFVLNSPILAKIEVVKYGKVRRAKLYYLRNRTGKATRIKEDKKAAAAK